MAWRDELDIWLQRLVRFEFWRARVMSILKPYVAKFKMAKHSQNWMEQVDEISRFLLWPAFRAIFIDFIFVRALLIMLTLLVPGNGLFWRLILALHTILFWTLPEAKMLATITKSLILYGVSDYAEKEKKHKSAFRLATYTITLLACYTLVSATYTALICALTVLPHLILFQIELDLNARKMPSRAEILRLLGSAAYVLDSGMPYARLLGKWTLKRTWAAGLWLYGQFSAHRKRTVTAFLQNVHSIRGESLNRYRYQSLKDDEIRLLKFTPSLFGGVQCQIVHQSIHNLPPYEAISYTWGDQSKVHVLYIQPGSPLNFFQDLWPLSLVVLDAKWMRILGYAWNFLFDLWPLSLLRSKSRWLLITANVRDILIDRASMFTIKYVWIDSLCINQADKYEKSKQVLIMQQIYGKATVTTVWLGNSPDAATAHRFLHEILGRILFPQKVDLAVPVAINEDNPKFVALRTLFLHPYWFRAWIIQEIATSKQIRVFYGRRFVHWETLFLCVNSLYSMKSGSMLQILDATEGPSTLPFPALAQMIMLDRIRIRFQNKKILSILDLLTGYPVVQATDPRDRIFALRGISLEADTKMLSPDYTSTIHGVYMDTTWHALHSDRPFQLFPFAGLALRFTANENTSPLNPNEITPTWVADWRYLQELPHLTPVSTHMTIPDFQASKDTKAKITVGAESNILKVKGILVDKVLKLATLPPTTKMSLLLSPGYRIGESEFGDFKSEYVRHKEAMEMTKKYIPDPYVDGTPLTEAFWRTMICDTTHSRPAEVEFGTWYKRIYGMLKISHETDYTVLDGISSESTRVSLKAVISTLRLFESLPEEALDFLETLNLSSGPSDDFASNLSLMMLLPIFKEVQKELIATRPFGHITKGILSRQFAITEKGYMALVPLGTQVGDAVCIFYGAGTPFLLRNKLCTDAMTLNGEPKTWELVGQAYVHGLMYGKGLDLGLEPEWFNIV